MSRNFLNTNKTTKGQLGISIDLLEVRLITRIEDPYSWQSLPTRTYLFEKNLSKHSIGAYMELYREVSVSFKAMAKEVHKLIVTPSIKLMPAPE
jgi:hypothetical protein